MKARCAGRLSKKGQNEHTKKQISSINTIYVLFIRRRTQVAVIMTSSLFTILSWLENIRTARILQSAMLEKSLYLVEIFIQIRHHVHFVTKWWYLTIRTAVNSQDVEGRNTGDLH